MMKNISIMIKPASSLCNLRCKYCFYADVSSLRDVSSFGVMREETMDQMLSGFEKDLSDGDAVTFGFQGGEPTMAGLEYFRRFTDRVKHWNKKINVSYALQTNGTLLNDEWCIFLAENHFLVGLSLDLLPENHDGVRVDTQRKGTYRKVCQAKELLDRHKVEYNVLCTLTRQIARHPQQVWKKVKEMDIRFTQFTPCLDELEKPGESVYALTPKRYASFYTQIFDYWFEDYCKGQYRSIKLFDDIVNLLAYGVPTACGINGKCSPQFIVEADGSVYPCDFYCLDTYRLGNVVESSISQLLASDAARSFRERETQAPALCSSCEFARFCGGGCKRMQRETCCSGEDMFCGYKAFLQENMDKLQRVAMHQRQLRGQ